MLSPIKTEVPSVDNNGSNGKLKFKFDDAGTDLKGAKKVNKCYLYY